MPSASASSTSRLIFSRPCWKSRGRGRRRMPAARDRKIVLVTRRTRFEDLIARHHTQAQARFYVERLGGDFSGYQAEHDAYGTAKRQAVEVLEQWGRYQ